ncbi:MAG: hypothetical protein V3U33_04855 [candidate division NC10 bacterium]
MPTIAASCATLIQTNVKNPWSHLDKRVFPKEVVSRLAAPYRHPES